MDFDSFKQAVIDCCSRLGIEDYELYFQWGESVSVGIFRQEINQFTASEGGGVCFRCIVDGKMGYASTQDLSEAQAAAIVERAADNAATLETVDPVFLGEGGQEYASFDRELYDLPSTEELIAAALDTQSRLYAADPKVVDGSTTYAIKECEKLAIYNSKGLDLHYVNQIAALAVTAVVSDGQEKSNNYQVKLAKLDTIDRDALTKKAVTTAISRMGGETAPTGVYPVVFSPEAMALLLQTFCRIFSSEAAQKGLSRLAEAEGTVIASEAVTVVDDPFHKDSPMPIHFDAEGSPTVRKNVVEKGVLKTLLYNLKTANIAGKKTTGNASKGGYNSSVAVRPFTMYLAAGTLSEDALLAQAGTGVYIDTLEGLHAGANSVSGDFSLQSGGYLIENGKKTTRVHAFTVAGNFYDLLKNITAVSDTVVLPRPMGITAFGSPSVLVKELSIAGK